jgi:hypothetical protein
MDRCAHSLKFGLPLNMHSTLSENAVCFTNPTPTRKVKMPIWPRKLRYYYCFCVLFHFSSCANFVIGFELNYYYSVAFVFILCLSWMELPISTLCCVCNWHCSYWLGTLIIKNLIELLLFILCYKWVRLFGTRSTKCPTIIKNVYNSCMKFYMRWCVELAVARVKYTHFYCNRILPFRNWCLIEQVSIILDMSISV